MEYRVPGINQVQVSPLAGMTFPAALRAILRQDPDIVMIGEIRDRETAEIAMAAAVTGHLVLSTIHTTDAPGAITRLLHMGVPPYLVAGGLTGVVAQRLVRTLCTACRGHRADGCGRCTDGYAGRTVCFRCSRSTTICETKSFEAPPQPLSAAWPRRVGWLPSPRTHVARWQKASPRPTRSRGSFRPTPEPWCPARAVAGRSLQRPWDVRTAVCA